MNLRVVYELDQVRAENWNILNSCCHFKYSFSDRFINKRAPECEAMFNQYSMYCLLINGLLQNLKLAEMSATFSHFQGWFIGSHESGNAAGPFCGSFINMALIDLYFSSIQLCDLRTCSVFGKSKRRCRCTRTEFNPNL